MGTRKSRNVMKLMAIAILNRRLIQVQNFNNKSLVKKNSCRKTQLIWENSVGEDFMRHK